MSVKAILFDLDGTLLPMDQDVFIENYIKALTKKLSKAGYEPTQFVNALWSGIKKMMHNDGQKNNEEVFWEKFGSFYTKNVEEDKPIFEDFYRNEFQELKSFCGQDPIVSDIISLVKQKGYRLILATNPVFPPVAVESRISWAGLSPLDFEMYTNYENSSYSKPDPRYYDEVAKKIGLAPSECLMIGNDVRDDMSAKKIGMEVFLVTNYLINIKKLDISEYPNGDYKTLYKFIQNMPDVK